MASFDTQVLFIPYRGNSGSKKVKDAGAISQQKHAAREYHRKAKLRKQSQRAQQKSPEIGRQDSSSEDGQVTDYLTSRSISPSNDSLSTCTDRSLQPQYSRTPSPTTSLGAGRIDPFDSKPVKDLTPHVHHMVDYALTYQWPIFSFVNPGFSVESMKQHMTNRLHASQASFYTVIYAAATHYALSRVGEQASHANQVLRLNYKDRALKLLRESFVSSEDKPIEVMQAMFAMTSYGNGTTEHIAPMRGRDMKNPLAVSYDLDVYSRIPPEMAHVHALYHMIDQKGGLSSLSRPGFAQVIALNDTFLSFRALKRPRFPLLKPTSHYLQNFDVDESKICLLCRPLQLLLPKLPESPRVDELASLLRTVLLITLAYEQHQRFDECATSLQNILMARHCTLHDLLELGGYKSSGITELDRPDVTARHEDTIFDLAWLSTMAYMVLDLYPLYDRAPGPHEELARRLSKTVKDAIRAKVHSQQLILFEWANELLARLIVPLAD